MTMEEYLVDKIQRLEKENNALKVQIQDKERFHKSELLNVKFEYWKERNDYEYKNLKEQMPKKEMNLIKCDSYHVKSLFDLVAEFGFDMVEQWLIDDITTNLEEEAEEDEQ